MRLWPRRTERRLRYYLYISDAKLDMLFEQIDQSAFKRISAEAKVDLKLAGLTVKRGADPAVVRSAKLRVVERFIDRHHQVGTIDEPGNEYFRGRMTMAWGWLHNTTAEDLVLFQGQQNENTVVLAGSSRHVLGWNEPKEEQCGRSSFPGKILWALDEYVRAAPGTHELATLTQQDKDRFPRRWPTRRNWRSKDPWTGEPNTLTAMLNEPFFTANQRFLRRPNALQRLEFLAVPLAQDKTRKSRGYHPMPPDSTNYCSNAVLGTPLYVAVAAESATQLAD